MDKSKPCPICGKDLDIPIEYLDAYNVLREKIEGYVSVGIVDFIKKQLKPVLFKIAKSHSQLSHDEYKRNYGYNNTNFSYIAENELVTFMERHSLFNDFIKYMGEGD